jgi:thymidylate kinase
VFSLCGLDGVGKTSMFETLAKRYTSPDFVFVGRGPADAEDLIERSFPRRHRDFRDWIEGPFSAAMAIACAMDYAVYHRATIARLLDGSCARLFGRAPRAIVTDRHALCFVAYAASGGAPDPTAIGILDAVSPPDVVFLIEASEETIAHRRKGERTHEFDDPRIQQAVKRGYAWALGRHLGEIVRIDNSGAFDDSVRRISTRIEEAIAHRPEES